MVATECDSDAVHCRYVLRPNRSMSWRAASWFLLAVAVFYIVSGAVFAWLGLWLILPFAGAEFLALWYCMYLTSRDSARCEVISLDRDSVRIEQGRGRPEETRQFQRAWAQVRLLKDRRRGYPSRLLIRSHGNEIEIGAFLNNDERAVLARNLAHVMGLVSQRIPRQ